MIIAVDATAIGSGLGGDETLVSGMLRGLCAAAPPQTRIEVLCTAGVQLSPEVVSDPRVRLTPVRRRGGSAHFAITAPGWLRSLHAAGVRPDVVLSNTHGPLRSPVPVALTLPDLSFLRLPDSYPLLTRLRLRSIIARQVRTAATVLTISEFSRGDLIDTYRMHPEKVHVVPPTADCPSEVEPAARDRLAARGVAGSYLLYLGNLHPRKNVPRAIAAFVRMQRSRPETRNRTLVIAGGRWFAGSAEQAAAALAPDGQVIFLGRVDDQEREVLLRDAHALVYLSLFEGFGLPPIEAMMRGTPVLASNTTAVAETCGDAALLVDPTDEAAIANAMARLCIDESFAGALARGGPARAAQFNVERTGRALTDALTA